MVMSKNTQIGLRIPTELYKILENERLEAEIRGEKTTMTELIIKYLYAGLNRSPEVVKDDVSLMPTLERLTSVLERLESKL
jgi:hypothetical protein